MQVRAEDDVLPDDAVEFERRQPGDEDHGAAGGGGFHPGRRSRDCGGGKHKHLLYLVMIFVEKTCCTIDNIVNILMFIVLL